MAQKTLQSRLDAVFSALKQADEPQWRPTTEQVFRTGAPVVDQEPSSDEEAEFEERQRREVVPGLAMDLATEDEPDEEGFMPSTAFCRALDREEEYNDDDFLATGTYSGRREDTLPPRNMEVLEDNIWEQRIAQREAHHPSGGLSQPSAMEMDSLPEAVPAPPPAAEGANDLPPLQLQRHEAGEESPEGGVAGEGTGGQAEGRLSPRSALATGARTKAGVPKRVRFSGVAEPWVPPHRREGYVSRDPEGGPPSGDTQAAVPHANVKPKQRGIAQSRVPDHVQHPEKYTLYTLDEPLVVGAGLAQLGAEQVSMQLEQAAANAFQDGQGAAAEDVAEPERWQGAVGGGIQFRPKARRAGDAPKPAPEEAADVDTSAAGSLREAGRGAQAAVRLAIDADEEREAGAGGGDEEQGGGAAAVEGGAGDAQMHDAAAGPQQPVAGFKQPKNSRRVRGYRSKAAAAGEEES